MIRKSVAVWRGDGTHGKGTLTTQSGVLREEPFSLETRLQYGEGNVGTAPEELLGAAHAGCYAMTLALALTEAGRVPFELQVSATVDLGLLEDAFAIQSIVLELQARVPDLDPATFHTEAERAKKECPVSKALAATPISLSAKLI